MGFCKPSRHIAVRVVLLPSYVGSAFRRYLPNKWFWLDKDHADDLKLTKLFVLTSRNNTKLFVLTSRNKRRRLPHPSRTFVYIRSFVIILVPGGLILRVRTLSQTLGEGDPVRES